MTRQKERLQKVIVIGATPEGIAATNKLGELGIPVTLIESSPDLNHKLAAENYRTPSGLTFNSAHRPGLIRIMRNSSIRTILPARINAIKHTSQGFSVRATQEQTFIDEAKCTLCGNCKEICPVTTSDGCRPITFYSRAGLPGRPFIDKRRKPLCQESCPLGVNAQGYVALAAEGRYQEAIKLIRENNILPGICGRICTHPCEDACRRGELDEPVSIRAIKRFLADYTEEKPEPVVKSNCTNGKVAIIGSGPAGLAAAAELARLDYEVTVYEKGEKPGGLLRYGIGTHRLPEETLNREIDHIQNMGVQFLTATEVDLTKELPQLEKEYKSVLISAGTWKDRALGVKGEDLEGVEGCINFLSRSQWQEPGRVEKKVAVIGDGNAAFDLARTLLRLGADVTLFSWFSREEIPADEEEVREGLEEGLKIIDATQVVGFQGKDGVFSALECRPTLSGPADAKGIQWPVIDEEKQPFLLEFDQAFVAIGQIGGFTPQTHGSTFEVTESGFIKTDDVLRTKRKGLYAAGDGVTGPSSVVHAMASGKQAAATLHADLQDITLETTVTRPQEKDFSAIPTDIPCQKRPDPQERQPGKRKNNFDEVNLGLTQQQIVDEAKRCLQCGVCSECFECITACGALKAIDHAQQEVEIKEQAGVLIVADPQMATSVKGEDVIRAYGPKAARSNVNDMVVRGFAAAANAKLLLGSTSPKRTKGYGMAFAVPDAGMDQEARIGVFVCKCNDSLGWLDSMDDYLESLQAKDKAVMHVETLQSACVSEGINSIIKTTREKNLTRIVLGSCVCCPLNFVCSACTDQRSRLKDSLFHGTGIFRSMVETCNLRGEILRLIEDSPQLAQERFQGLLHRSIERTKTLKPLPTVDRNYNFTVAVIGNSQATLNSAYHLAETDHNVFRFGTTEQPLVDTLSHENIHSFEGWDVKALSGTVGDFQLLIESENERQVIRVGTVILGEKARRHLPYTHQEGLPTSSIEPIQQKKGVPGVPFATPGATSIPGLFLAEPPGINVSKLKKGAAAAIMAAAALPRGPRQSKGFTVIVDQKLCRGCGRCTTVCPYHAVSFTGSPDEGWKATVDEAICKGCGNCISVCPTSAADSPYRNRAYLEQALEEIISSDSINEYAK